MIFSSNTFLLYFLPAFLTTYYFIKDEYKNAVLLFFSILFYAWGGSYFIFIILATTFVDFHIVKWMAASDSQRKRKLLLAFSITINLSLLAYFKYSFFLVENFNAVSGVFSGPQIHWMKLALPLGISFYTFESLTYMIDVYRKQFAPLKNFYDYQLYIILFPKLLMGPIMRYLDIADQIPVENRVDTMDNRLDGFYRFTIGLCKKVLVADMLAGYVDNVFQLAPSSLHPFTCWMALIGFTFQVYFDFSGYSDMAIGIGKMVGFRLTENFHNPYVSTSVNEFWSKWHITLGSWMRNYLYIPIGGNRTGSKFRNYFNLIIVFLAVGMWHGASWSFIMWGFIQGSFIVLERIFLLKILERLGRSISIAYTFFVFMMGVIFIRADSIHYGASFFKHLFIPNGDGMIIPPDPQFYFVMAIAILFSFFTVPALGTKIQQYVFEEQHSLKAHIVFSGLSIVAVLFSVWILSASKAAPFIYFQY